jgi:hypothetical protein
MYLQKVINKNKSGKNLFFVGILSGQWRIKQDPDPDPYQNVTDPQHWFEDKNQIV